MKAFFCFCIALVIPLKLMAQTTPELREERDKLHNRGLFRDGLNFYQEKLLPISDEQSGKDLETAFKHIQQLAAYNELDDLLEQAISSHPDNPRVLHAAALLYQNAPHHGRLIAGQFERQAGYRGRNFNPESDPTASAGAEVETTYRDHIRSLQLLVQALPLTQDDTQKAAIWDSIAQNLRAPAPWKLQILSPIDTLPAWGEPGPDGATEGPPWSKDAPILYQIPNTWQSARTDGERWRFALSEKSRLNPASAPATTLELARFSESQFGTQTLASYGWWQQQDPESAKGILEMDTLAEDECLAKTSDGVRRFTLPPDQHFITLYRSILNEVPSAGDALAQVFLNRHQPAKARDALTQTIAKHGPGDNDSRKKLLNQITGNWGRFEPSETVPTGTKPKLPLVFRNAALIKLSAAPVDMAAVIDDTTTYIQSNPRELDWEKLSPSQIASRIIREDDSKYIGKITTSWESTLTPRENHRDTRADLEIPITQTGAWWVTGTLQNGNSFHTLIHIVDAVLVENDVGGKKQWWVADSSNGAPIPNSEIEFIGYHPVETERKLPLGRRFDILTKSFKRTTDADGKTLLNPGDWDPQYRWMVIARSPGKSPTFFNFQSYQIDSPRLENADQDLSYAISDRPLYKPGDTVHLKFFFRNVGYFQPNENKFANQPGILTLSNGRGEEVIKITTLKTDALGAAECEVIIPKDAVLGSWNASFRVGDQISASLALSVEEYRKPEYEVTVQAPEAPVKLGEKFTATIKATYFHGAPVRNASVEVTAKRASISQRWFPAWRWDWLYGPGAWWSGSEASWHPTWKNWGCIPPQPPWWQGDRWTPDEVILKRNLTIGEDGTAKLEIDTAPAKQIHGDMDANYTIEARVVDASRREETGTGSVIAARKPFEVVVWTDRGHARAGDPLEANISAATLAGKPVVGAAGRLTIFKLTRAEDGRILEQQVESFPIQTDAAGEVRQRFPAPATGQYRLAASLSFQGGDPAEGATILNVQAPGRTDPAAWNFGPLELVADRSSYTPGDSVKLRVNSDQTNAHVWLFLHVAGSAGREARRIQLDGKSLEVEVPLDLRDMPNMFIEGVTVFGAKVHTAVREILLPPAGKLIEVTLEPTKSRVKPQEKSSLRVTLRDSTGKPISGTAILSIYDKALEAITGGSNVDPIQENFWAWKNNYHPQQSAGSIPEPSGNLTKPKTAAMQALGRFSNSPMGGGGGMMFGRGFALGNGVAEMAAAPMEMAADGFAAKSALAESNAPFGAKPILVRKDFADLLKWSGAIQTDADGHAEIPLEFPDNLTTWKARVWVLTKGTQVGEGSTEIITSKQLLVRLQAPRFLVERDEAVLSAIVQNDHDSPKSVKISLELDGHTLTALDGAPQTLEIAANSEARVDWRVQALREGEATFRMRANSGDDGDAVERKMPVRVHGMLRQDAWSRVVEPTADSTKIQIEIPAQRRPDQSKLTVRFSPTIAGAVVDAIPYLAEYPHGCTEQTLNRFVPAVIAQQMLREMKVNLAEVKAKRNNLNPQELGNSATRATQWKQWQDNPVFDEAEITQRVASGIEKLAAMQNADGGWGWFSGYGETSYPHTTAVVVHGLFVANQNGAKIPEEMRTRGLAWLASYERTQVADLQRHVEREALRKEGKKLKPSNKPEKATTDAMDAFVRLVLGEAKRDSEPMLAFLHRDRITLPVYAKCLLALEHHRQGDEARRDEVMKMISQFLKRDPENQSAYLDLQNNTYHWNWYGSEIEAHAWYLKLLAAVKPNDPDTRSLVKYLVNNRKHATYWDSTRDTAFAIEAIASYFKASGEDNPDMEAEVLLDGKSLRKISITRENLFTFDGTITLAGDALATGKHDIELRKTGKGSLYANAYLEVFTLEDKLRAAGLEVKLTRNLSKLVALEKETEVPDATGLVVKQQAERFRREPLADAAQLRSGDRIEVELILDSKNDYEYLLFSDLKAAGFEALDSLSGYIAGAGLNAYMEPRDQSVNFFIRALPRGTHTLRYQLRAEAPGTYKALPATAEAMYAPELRANSDDKVLEIIE
jgi:uncharacterized protein YfaS (alpha-2-macroglobulin family)